MVPDALVPNPPGLVPAPRRPRRRLCRRRRRGEDPRFFRSDVLGPLLVNQFGAVPMAYYPFYFGWTGFVRGQSRDEILDAARAKYKLRLLAQNWAFWLPAQAAQFAVVPSGYHILYVSAMGLAWNTILSLTTLTSADASGEGARRENSAKNRRGRRERREGGKGKRERKRREGRRRRTIAKHERRLAEDDAPLETRAHTSLKLSPS